MRLGLGATISKKAIKRKPRSLFSNNKSLNFDSTNDYLKLASAQTLNKDNGSVSFWVKRDAIGANHGIFGHVSSTTINCYISTGGGERLYLRYGGNYLTSTTAIGTGWTHIVIVLSGSSSGAIYINGTPESSLVNNSIANNISFQVIASRAGSDMFFDGNIDEFAIWDTALDADAVTAIYNSGTPTNLSSDSGDYDNSSNLQGYWRMGDGTLDTYPLIADQTNATLGSNLVAEDDFSLGSGWSDTGTNSWSFTSGSYTNLLAQNISGVTIGKIYKAEWTIGSNPDSVQLKWVGVNMFNAGIILNTSVGTHTHYGIATTDDFGFRWQGTSGTLTISDIKLQEVNGNAGLMINMVSGDIEEDTP